MEPVHHPHPSALLKRIYKASPKMASIPPASTGVPYSRAIAIAVAAPELADEGAAAVADAPPPVPRVPEAVGPADAADDEDVPSSTVRFPHLAFRSFWQLT